MKELDFKISLAEANLIFKALGKMPFEDVYELIGKLNKQANQQLKGEEQVLMPQKNTTPISK